MITVIYEEVGDGLVPLTVTDLDDNMLLMLRSTGMAKVAVFDQRSCLPRLAIEANETIPIRPIVVLLRSHRSGIVTVSSRYRDAAMAMPVALLPGQAEFFKDDRHVADLMWKLHHQ